MSPLLELARRIHRLSLPQETAFPESLRQYCIKVLATLFETRPAVGLVIYDLISLLLVLPVYERIYIQRALRPLAQRMDATSYLTDVSRALQETDAWVDLNILTDKGRRRLPDMGLEISPELKLP